MAYGVQQNITARELETAATNAVDLIADLEAKVAELEAEVENLSGEVASIEEDNRLLEDDLDKAKNK
ncbi:hypothetical protein LCGC14_2659220 [marine sediment metagenome]|uniref:Uncharacterized protein n=1 Tax=marine sediment metagenome TaxID=412755 RepID=A0A0F8ZSD8_9ZZZZ